MTSFCNIKQNFKNKKKLISAFIYWLFSFYHPSGECITPSSRQKKTHTFWDKELFLVQLLLLFTILFFHIIGEVWIWKFLCILFFNIFYDSFWLMIIYT